MVKVDIKTLDSTTANDVTATKTINDNFEALQNAVEDSLSRSGKVPNYMQTDLDLNHNKLINLADPKEDRDAVTLKYVKDNIGDAKGYADKAEAEAIKANKTVEAARTYLQNSVDEARIWANGDDDEVNTIAPGQDKHSSKGYADLSMAIANTPEDTPIDLSTLLAVDVIRGPKGEKGDKGDQGLKGDKGDPGEALSGDVEYEGTLNVISDNNHPVKVTGMAGTSASGFQIQDSLGAGETDLEHFATGDRYGSRITNRSTATGKETHIDLYQTNAGKSVMDFTDVDSVIVPTPDSDDNSERTVNSAWVNSAIDTRTLKTSQIANCITEIPQDIKLELNNGTLTVKAGSKIWIPYGKTEAYKVGDTDKYGNTVFETIWDGSKFFYAIKLAKDVSQNYARTDKKERLAFFDVKNNVSGALSYASGTSPISSSLYYRTDANTIGYYNADGSVTETSLPIAEIIADGTYMFGSVKRVLNGISYIGSTVFALPGVKCLIPKGRNADGTLKNKEFINETLRTTTITSSGNFDIYLSGSNFYVSNVIAYDIDKNVNYGTSNKDVRDVCNCGSVRTGDDKLVTLFTPKLPFRAVDSNEADYVIKTYVNGTEWYRQYKSGWIKQGGVIETVNKSPVTLTFHKPMKNTNYTFSVTQKDGTEGDFSNGFNTKSYTTTNLIIVNRTGGTCPTNWTLEGQGE